MSQLIQKITEKRHPQIKTPPKVGDKTAVHVRISEGGKERIQVFQGVVLKLSGKGVSRSFTVRKISDGIGVERTFPLASPVLSKVEILSRSKVRRAKLYYIRKLKGRASRLTSAFFSKEDQNNESPKASAEPKSTPPKEEDPKKASSKPKPPDSK